MPASITRVPERRSTRVVIKQSLLEAPAANQNPFSQLPLPVLLLTIPQLLAHPPTHPLHVNSLRSSFCAVKRAVDLSSKAMLGAVLTPELECRAWTMLAEIGLKIADATTPRDLSFDEEIVTAISNGLRIATKHPALRNLRIRLSLIDCQLAHSQSNRKFARSALKKLASSHSPNDATHVVYATHLALINQLLDPLSSNSGATSSSFGDFQSVLEAISTLSTLCTQNMDDEMIRLLHVIRLTTLVKANEEGVQEALDLAEASLDLIFETSAADSSSPSIARTLSATTLDMSTTSDSQTQSSSVTPTGTRHSSLSNTPHLAALSTQVLALGILHYTNRGQALSASSRLTRLHELLDARDIYSFPDGVVEIPLRSCPQTPLRVKVTHPVVFHHLGFLISSVSKRDAIGRKPKRKVFSTHGLTLRNSNAMESECGFSVCDTLEHVRQVEYQLAMIKADLLCEMLAICTMRGEFDEAEKHMAELVSHTRKHDMFSDFSDRITLHSAHLAQAMGRSVRALECYQAAAYLALQGGLVWICAKAGEVALRLGLAAKAGQPPDCDVLALGGEIVEECRNEMNGSIVQCIGKLLEACLCQEIVKAKQYLKQALQYASGAHDNYIRLLILTLASSHYLDTTSEHAKLMLQTCRQLAAGLGATTKTGDPAGSVGNPVVGLWVGERILELHQKAGDDVSAQEQIATNHRLSASLRRVEERGLCSIPDSVVSAGFDKDGDHVMSFPKNPFLETMIGLKGTLNVIDNSGALLIECVNVLKCKTKHGFAGVGDEIVCVVQRARPISATALASTTAVKVRAGDVRRAVVVRTKKTAMRPDGRFIRFDDNAAVLINNKREMLGTRISGVVSADLRFKGWSKIVALASKVV